jgi:acyl phosphate:glycerol-3-phosphate acyltransferase
VAAWGNPMTGVLVAAIVGYLLGSIPFGLVVTRIAGAGDIRQIGSGSIGATNVLRTGNKTLAALTLFFDVAKGIAAVGFGWLWGTEAAVAAAIAVSVGHMFPVWLGFRGGKGVATALGVLLVLAWPVALGSGLLWLATAVIFHYSSLAALVAAVATAALVGFVVDTPRAVAIGVIAVLIVVRHRDNIHRLLDGTESRISFRKG